MCITIFFTALQQLLQQLRPLALCFCFTSSSFPSCPVKHTQHTHTDTHTPHLSPLLCHIWHSFSWDGLMTALGQGCLEFIKYPPRVRVFPLAGLIRFTYFRWTWMPCWTGHLHWARSIWLVKDLPWYGQVSSKTGVVKAYVHTIDTRHMFTP
jgi:hypothetical protein